MPATLPTEIINLIFSFKEPHPTARIIADFVEDMECEAYENWGGSYPDLPEDDEGEMTLDEIKERTLFQNARDASHFLGLVPELVYNPYTGDLFDRGDFEFEAFVEQRYFSKWDRRVVRDYNVDIHPAL